MSQATSFHLLRTSFCPGCGLVYAMRDAACAGIEAVDCPCGARLLAGSFAPGPLTLIEPCDPASPAVADMAAASTAPSWCLCRGRADVGPECSNCGVQP